MRGLLLTLQRTAEEGAVPGDPVLGKPCPRCPHWEKLFRGKRAVREDEERVSTLPWDPQKEVQGDATWPTQEQDPEWIVSIPFSTLFPSISFNSSCMGVHLFTPFYPTLHCNISIQHFYTVAFLFVCIYIFSSSALKYQHYFPVDEKTSLKIKRFNASTARDNN